MSIAAHENLGNLSVTNNTFTQETSSFCGKLVSSISRNTSYIAQSVNSIAQLILSKCIYIGSLGRYTIDDLRSYFFSERSPLEDTPSDEGLEDSQSNKSSEQLNTAIRQDQVGSVAPPPPPPLPLPGQLNAATRTRQSQVSATSTVAPPSEPPLSLSEQLNAATRQSQVGSTSTVAPPSEPSIEESGRGNKDFEVTADSLKNTLRSLRAPRKDDSRVKPVEKKEPFNFLQVLRNKNKESKKTNK